MQLLPLRSSFEAPRAATRRYLSAQRALSTTSIPLWANPPPRQADERAENERIQREQTVLKQKMAMDLRREGQVLPGLAPPLPPLPPAFWACPAVRAQLDLSVLPARRPAIPHPCCLL